MKYRRKCIDKDTLEAWKLFWAAILLPGVAFLLALSEVIGLYREERRKLDLHLGRYVAHEKEGGRYENSNEDRRNDNKNKSNKSTGHTDFQKNEFRETGLCDDIITSIASLSNWKARLGEQAFSMTQEPRLFTSDKTSYYSDDNAPAERTPVSGEGTRTSETRVDSSVRPRGPSKVSRGPRGF